MDEPLLCVAANYWVPSQHVFRFNKIELCPIIEEFGAIMGELEINDLIFPTMGGGLLSLLQVVLGVPSTTTNRWCVFGKLNLRLVFEYFSSSTLMVGERLRSNFLLPFACVLLKGIS